LSTERVNSGMMMSSRDALEHLDSGHCRAICDEIGDRLRFVLAKEAGTLPQRLQMLIDRLAEPGREQAPSIVPAMDDRMAWPVAA
jgi:hypothetical protein